ncbi:hypothetical protein NMY22_g14382 [Coprinellus aureogranulatus]|nr:hypothetical protein NMY22_g14382 [Coprinellus aureogranulatus]
MQQALHEVSMRALTDSMVTSGGRGLQRVAMTLVKPNHDATLASMPTIPTLHPVPPPIDPGANLRLDREKRSNMAETQTRPKPLSNTVSYPGLKMKCRVIGMAAITLSAFPAGLSACSRVHLPLRGVKIISLSSILQDLQLYASFVSLMLSFTVSMSAQAVPSSAILSSSTGVSELKRHAGQEYEEILDLQYTLTLSTAIPSLDASTRPVLSNRPEDSESDRCRTYSAILSPLSLAFPFLASLREESLEEYSSTSQGIHHPLRKLKVNTGGTLLESSRLGLSLSRKADIAMFLERLFPVLATVEGSASTVWDDIGELIVAFRKQRERVAADLAHAGLGS